jgi:hypothetical protein
MLLEVTGKWKLGAKPSRGHFGSERATQSSVSAVARPA